MLFLFIAREIFNLKKQTKKKKQLYLSICILFKAVCDFSFILSFLFLSNLLSFHFCSPTSQLYAGLMLFFISNAIEGQLISTGAFEILYNGKKLYRYLNSETKPFFIHHIYPSCRGSNNNYLFIETSAHIVYDSNQTVLGSI